MLTEMANHQNMKSLRKQLIKRTDIYTGTDLYRKLTGTFKKPWRKMEEEIFESFHQELFCSPISKANKISLH